MKKEEALRSILRQWRNLPDPERRSEADLVAFSMQKANDSDFWFQCRGDRYQDIMAYMSRNISGLKK